MLSFYYVFEEIVEGWEAAKNDENHRYHSISRSTTRPRKKRRGSRREADKNKPLDGHGTNQQTLCKVWSLLQNPTGTHIQHVYVRVFEVAIVIELLNILT